MLSPNQEILFTRQRHEADKMGLHWDYRLVAGDKAYSWATKKELPEPGRSIVLFEQPVHDRAYALSKKVVIPKGLYGAGTTYLDWVHKATIGEHSTADQMTIVTNDGQKFLLKRIPDSEWGKKAWLFRNLQKTGNKYIEKAASLIAGAAAAHLAQNIGMHTALKSRTAAKYLADAFSEGAHGVINNSAKAKLTRVGLGAGLPDLEVAHKTMHDAGRLMNPILAKANPRQKAAIRMLTEGKFDRVQKLGLHQDPVVREAHAAMSKHLPLPSLDTSMEKAKKAGQLWNDPKHPILSNILKNSGRGHVPEGKHFVKGDLNAKLPMAGAAGSLVVDPAAGALNSAKTMMSSNVVKGNKYGAKAVDMLEKQFVKNPIKAGLENPKYNGDSLKHHAYAIGVNPVSASLKRTSAALADAL